MGTVEYPGLSCSGRLGDAKLIGNVLALLADLVAQNPRAGRGPIHADRDPTADSYRDRDHHRVKWRTRVTQQHEPQEEVIEPKASQ